MNYFAEFSLFSFSIHLLASIIIWYYKMKDIALFIMFIGVMSLFNFIFWKHQNVADDNVARINYIFTKVAMIWQHAQPVVLALLIMLYANLKPVSQIMLSLYIPSAILYSIMAYNTSTYTIAYDNKKAIVQDWNTLHILCICFYSLLLATLLLLSYENFPFPINIILCFICILSVFRFGSYWQDTMCGCSWCKQMST